jgi:hypothetical protein
VSLRWTLFRTASAAGVLAGVVLLIRPDEALARLAPEYPRDRLWVVRLLGARLVAQHAAVVAAPSAALLRAAGRIDLMHAVTMLPLLRSPRYGRAARISGAVAASYGTWASVAGRMGR